MEIIKKKSKPKSSAGKRKVLSSVRTIVESIVIVLLLRAFVVEAHAVPTGSMKSTILPGEFLLAEKISYRFGDPVPGDIVVFKYPGEPPVDYVKRCIATEGQHVKINSKKLLVNDSELDFKQAQYVDNSDIVDYDLNISKEKWQYNWENRQLYNLVFARMLVLESIQYLRAQGISVDEEIFSDYLSDGAHGAMDYLMVDRDYSKYMNALSDAYQQAFSLSKPDSIPGSMINRVINIFLKSESTWRARSYKYIRDNFEEVVVPEGNIFCMGDNRDESHDSRFWGPVPLDNVKGRPVLLYYSVPVEPPKGTPTILDNILVIFKSFFRPGDIRFSRFFTFLF